MLTVCAGDQPLLTSPCWEAPSPSRPHATATARTAIVATLELVHRARLLISLQLITHSRKAKCGPVDEARW